MKNNRGFTLVELMVVSALIALLLVGMSNLFFAILTGGGKATELAELKGQGEFAMITMERLIRNGNDVDGCSPASNSITVNYVDPVTDPDVGFRLNGTALERDTLSMTTSDVVVSGGPIFDCVGTDYNDTFIPDEVRISFTISAGTISEDFQTTVVQRNATND